jgi:D-alanyl-lipoteichoic acid acyltransferase DltB (MBOAT superfamily)
LLGLFQKVVIADRAAALVSTFLRPQSGAALTLLGICTYAIQIFADFSGYSDIARGVARWFGIEVIANFRAPYLSRNLPEYWRRWHISLSTWLEDYVYKPSGMWLRRWGLFGALAATVLTFFVSALWHGRGATFLCWGAIHVLGVSMFMTTRGLRKRLKSRLPAVPLQLISTALTFAVVCFAYVFFRAPDVGSALSTLVEVTHLRPVNLPVMDDAVELIALTGSVAAVHYLQLQDAPHWVRERPVWLRAAAYAAMVFFVVRLPGASQGFIYFQF